MATWITRETSSVCLLVTVLIYIVHAVSVKRDSIKTYVADQLINEASDDALQAGHAAFALWYSHVRIREPRYRLK